MAGMAATPKAMPDSSRAAQDQGPFVVHAGLVADIAAVDLAEGIAPVCHHQRKGKVGIVVVTQDRRYAIG